MKPILSSKRKGDVNMSEFVLSCCTTVDLAKKHLEDKNINYIQFHFYMDGTHYYDDLGETISYDDFYKAMVDGVDTKTSQINASEYEEYFRKFLDEGKDILHISLSSGISGSFNSANIAKSMLEEEYPDRKIYVIDSVGAASGYGLLLDKAAELREAGMGIDELASWIEENKLRVQTWFFSSDLTFFVKGGRVSKAAGLIGGALSICPVLIVDKEGKLSVNQKVRTKKKAAKTLVDIMEVNAEDGLAYADKCYLSHSACLEDAKAIAAMIEERFPNLKGGVLINNIGTTIGSHTGPGTIALFYWGKERV